eukprot:TRINITY_DN3544_c0_g1_i1.p1 TRINITY_DN3544_c0_g1~~TRINITY_DN3544_c0_g1_i1.p1  ORF type:complete len:395 (-),score=98.88 TRINITY_DN3544_c0_g1_i1:296-1480(-)
MEDEDLINQFISSQWEEISNADRASSLGRGNEARPQSILGDSTESLQESSTVSGVSAPSDNPHILFHRIMENSTSNNVTSQRVLHVSRPASASLGADINDLSLAGSIHRDNPSSSLAKGIWPQSFAAALYKEETESLATQEKGSILGKRIRELQGETKNVDSLAAAPLTTTTGTQKQNEQQQNNSPLMQPVKHESSPKVQGGPCGISQPEVTANVGAFPNGSAKPRTRARRGQATDPHSIAERLRRERIAERMKSLQELVPNSNKSDKASMLDEIIEYVKFLQMQVKVLSTSRLGCAGAIPSFNDDNQSKDVGSQGLMTGDGDGELLSQEGQAFEKEVAKLMESNITAAMQYLQNKGLCLMPIALARAISNSSGKPLLVSGAMDSIQGETVDGK